MQNLTPYMDPFFGNGTIALEILEDETKPFKDQQGAEAAYANALKLEQQIREGGTPTDAPKVIIEVVNGRGNNGK